MSLFRKHVDVAEPGPPQQQSPQQSPPISGSAVDFHAVYTFAQVTVEERDRVARAEELLTSLPGKASHTKEVVDATLRAFGVDAAKIVDAASKELRALEGYIRTSQEQAQRGLDQGVKRIAELEAEIARCRQVNALAASEQEDRARTVNVEMLRVQQVLNFFGNKVDVVEEVDPGEPDEPTEVGGNKRAGGRRLAPPAGT